MQHSILESVKSDPIRLEACKAVDLLGFMTLHVQVLKESFDMLDRDHSGFIDLTNLTESLVRSIPLPARLVVIPGMQRALGIDRSEKQIKGLYPFRQSSRKDLVTWL